VQLIVLAGGRGSRLGGTDKATVVVAGRTLLSRALDAREFATEAVVVGPPSLDAAAKAAGASRVLEEPVFGGPVAGIAAGLAALERTPITPDDGLVLVLACDLPWARDAAALVVAARDRLRPGLDGIHLADRAGRALWLIGIYRNHALRAGLDRLGDSARGASVRSLLAGLALDTVADATGVGRDVDTWEDVHESITTLERQSQRQEGTP
jgi:molybdopterin-guanine dinucleotide biosynthesis protein A